jgi:hypothetical protein
VQSVRPPDFSRIAARYHPLRARLVAGVLVACLAAPSYVSAQTLINNLGGALLLGGAASVPGQVSQIAFAPGDDAHAYIATYGNGIWRYDYDPASANFLSNPVKAVPAEIAGAGGTEGSLGIAFHQDVTLGTVMYIAPAVPFAGGGGINNLVDQSLVRLTDANGDGLWGNGVGDLHQSIVTNVGVSYVHQINQLQVRGDTLYAAIGIRTQNGGQTAAQNQAIGGSGVDQANPGETAYTGTVSFIEDLTLLSQDIATSNLAGFSRRDLTGDGVIDDRDVRGDALPFTSTDTSKLRVYATGFRNGYGIAIDDSGEMWVSMNQNENPNLPDELHRGVAFRTDHQYFKGNDVVGDWRVVGDEDPALVENASQIALDAGYFDPANSIGSFALLGFNTAAGGLDFFGPQTRNASVRGDALVSRFAFSGQDVVHVDRETGATTVVLQGLPGALEVQRDPFGNFLAGGRNLVVLLQTPAEGGPSGIPGDLNNDFLIDVADWNLFKSNFGIDTSSMGPVDARLAGDLNADGAIDFGDAREFARLYEAANGTGSLAELAVVVPEPGPLRAALFLATFVLGVRVRGW